MARSCPEVQGARVAVVGLGLTANGSCVGFAEGASAVTPTNKPTPSATIITLNATELIAMRFLARRVTDAGTV